MGKDASPPVFRKLIFWNGRKICKWFTAWCGVIQTTELKRKLWLTVRWSFLSSDLKDNIGDWCRFIWSHVNTSFDHSSETSSICRANIQWCSHSHFIGWVQNVLGSSAFFSCPLFSCFAFLVCVNYSDRKCFYREGRRELSICKFV